MTLTVYAMKYVMKTLMKHREYFDLSNYSKNSKYFCNDNKKVLGKMKDEYDGNFITEFIGLRSKIYSMLDTKNNKKSTHKGHNSYIKYDEFCDTIFNKNVLRHKIRGIKFKNHNLITYESNKTSTSCFVDKRYILNNGINTLPYGHKDIPKNEEIKKYFLIFLKYKKPLNDIYRICEISTYIY